MAVPCSCCPAAGINACYNYDPGGVPTDVELLANGDFSASTGIGAASSVGPGWTTSYTPCGPNLFAPGCGANRYAFFDTNAGQATGNNPAAVPLYARQGRSMAVNVGPNTSIPIIEWANIPLVNGQAYRFRISTGIIFNPYSVAMRIDGGAQGIVPVPAPSADSVWESKVINFVFSGPTGNYPFGLYSNSGVAAGNDHVFDEFSLIAVSRQAFLFVCADDEIRWFDSETGDELTQTEIDTLRRCTNV